MTKNAHNTDPVRWVRVPWGERSYGGGGEGLGEHTNPRKNSEYDLSSKLAFMLLNLG